MAQPTGEPTPTPVAPPAVPPTATPPAPPAFDPANPSPEVKAYLDAERARIKADEEAKARIQSKANATAEEQARWLKVLQDAGMLPGGAVPSDPAAVATQLAAAQAERTGLLRTQAIERAAWGVKADPARVAAILAYEGKLDQLDPAAPDFAEKAKALVEAAVTANPWMKAEGAPSTPPAAGAGATGVGNAPPPVERAKGIGAAVAAWAKQK